MADGAASRSSRGPAKDRRSCRAGAGRSSGRPSGWCPAFWSSWRCFCSSSPSRSTWRRTITDLTLPFWIRTGSADAERQVLIAIAAAVITVVGVVFSITILALTLASQQFGPRMMRNFVRDVGNQVTLGVFVGTFVYSVLALGSISSRQRRVRALSVHPVAEALLLVDLGVLIYFIHHIAKSIQLPEVIAGIADDLMQAIDAEFPDRVGTASLAPHRCMPASRCPSSYPDRGARRRGAVAGQRLHPVRRLLAADRHRHPHRLVHPAGAPARPLPRHRASAGQGVARAVRLRKWPTPCPGRTSPGRTAPWCRIRSSPSTNWWRSPSGRCRRRSTTPSRR